MPISGSTVVRRQLGRRLRLASRAKLWRIESGKGPVKVADVRALCWLYGADQKTTDTLAALAVGTTAQGWWENYNDLVSDWFSLYIGLEAAAAHIRTYAPELVHGLLQTPAYARTLCETSNPDRNEAMIARLVKLRLERQRVLDRTPPLRLTAVLNAATLARLVGGEATMAEQVSRLRDLNKREEIDLRILPFEAGAHAAMAGPLTIFDFDDPDDPPVVYLETHTGARYLEKADELAEHRRIFDMIYQQAVPIEEHADEY
jgi:hypothetical protein